VATAIWSRVKRQRIGGDFKPQNHVVLEKTALRAGVGYQGVSGMRRPSPAGSLKCSRGLRSCPQRSNRKAIGPPWMSRRHDYKAIGPQIVQRREKAFSTVTPTDQRREKTFSTGMPTDQTRDKRFSTAMDLASQGENPFSIVMPVASRRENSFSTVTVGRSRRHDCKAFAMPFLRLCGIFTTRASLWRRAACVFSCGLEFKPTGGIAGTSFLDDCRSLPIAADRENALFCSIRSAETPCGRRGTADACSAGPTTQ
jgi:hypothetical protein